MIMDNSLMFVVYRSADNQGEPTVSPRLGKNHVMPEWYNDTVVNVLQGSEVTDDKFVVNIHCKNCRNWGEGSLDLSSTRGRFFYALGPPGKSLTSDNYNQNIQSHPNHPKQFNLNVAGAIGANGVPSFDTADDSSDDGADDSDDVLDGGMFMSRGVAFHGFVMSLAFSVVFPVGYLLLRLFNRVWVHWAAQAFGTVLVLLGMIVGIVFSVHDFDVSIVQCLYWFKLTSIVPEAGVGSPDCRLGRSRSCPLSHGSRRSRAYVFQEEGSSKPHYESSPRGWSCCNRSRVQRSNHGSFIGRQKEGSHRLCDL